MDKISIVQRRFGRTRSVETAALRRARNRIWEGSADEPLASVGALEMEEGEGFPEGVALPEVVCLLSEIASLSRALSPDDSKADEPIPWMAAERPGAPLGEAPFPRMPGEVEVAWRCPEALVALAGPSSPVEPDEEMDFPCASPEGEGEMVVDVELEQEQQAALRRSLGLEGMEVGASKEVPVVLTKESAFKMVFRFGGEADALLTTQEACQLLRVSKGFLYRKIRAGEIPCLRIGRYLRFRKRDLMERLVAEGTGWPAEDPNPDESA